MAPSFNPPAAYHAHVVDAVAYAIGKAIATNTMANDRHFKRLDGLGKASAIHTMALNMVPEVQAEALAAIGAFLRAVEAPEPVDG